MNTITVKVAKWMGGEKVARFSDPKKAWDFAYRNYLLTRVLIGIDVANGRLYGFKTREKF